MSEQEFLAFMDANGFAYQRIVHPAVFTCAEAELHRPQTSAVSTKNLFLCDKKARRFYLVVTAMYQSHHGHGAAGDAEQTHQVFF